MKQYLKNLIYRLAVLSILLVYVTSSSVTALSSEQKQIIDGGSLRFDVGCDVNSSSNAGTGKIYVIGDSLTKGMRDSGDLGGKLEEKGWDVLDIEGNNGFNITLSMPKIEEDESKIAESDAVLIGLGTNRDPDFPVKVTELVEKIRSFSDTTQIKWFNTADYGVTRGGYSDGEVNRIIDTKSEELNFSVIDWATEIGQNPDTYPTLPDGLHQTPEGFVARAQWTADQVGDAPADGGGTDTDTSTLALRDKLAQLLMPRVSSEADIDTVTTAKVGGYFVGRDSLSSFSTKIKDTQNAENPFLVSVDGEGGTVDVPIGSNPPSALEMGSKTDEEVKTIAKDFGTELAGLGVNMDLAPVADVVDDINGGVIKTRSFGNNNEVVTAKAGAFADGLREARVLPTFKHFPGHGHATTTPGGSTLADSHIQDAYTANKQQLLDGDLAPFVSLMQGTSSAVMTGHLIIPDIDANTPTSVSRKVITDFLRGELGYDGLLITDDLYDMAPIRNRFNNPDGTVNLPNAVLAAIKAGNDMALFNGNIDQIGAVLDRLEAAVASGDLSEDQVNESLRRIDTAKNFAGAPEVLDGCECGTSGTGSLEGGTHPEQVFNYFKDKGVSETGAAAIAGNLMMESYPTIDVTATTGSTLGIAQWLGSRKTVLIQYGNQIGVDQQDFSSEEQKEKIFASQLDFIWLEITGEGAVPGVPGNNRPNTLAALEAAGEDLAAATLAWQNIFEGAPGQGDTKRLEFAQQVFDSFANGSSGGSTTGGGGDCGQTTIDGLECPANMEPHPTAAGYFKMPEAPNGEYVVYSEPWKRYGSETLICALYTVGLAYNEAMGGESKLQIGNLNTPYGQPSVSHRWGVANDHYANGNKSAATDIGNYDTNATVTLGKLWVDTGIVKNIWWCPNDDSIEQILSYSADKPDGIAGQMKCIAGHNDHFHVDILDEYKLQEFSPSP